MSFAVDLNLLLYASNSDSENHRKAADFLESCASGGELFCLAWDTVMGYLRIATHPSIFDRPLAPREAVANIDALIGVPHCRLLAEEEGFWEIYKETTAGLTVRGNLVPDARLASLLRQHGIRTIYTHDRDFLKFPFLHVRDPVA